MSDGRHPLAGPTGKFPRGKTGPGDEGELRVAVTADRARNLVILDFGKSVSWLSASPDEIRQIALQLLRSAGQVDGKILTVKTS